MFTIAATGSNKVAEVIFYNTISFIKINKLKAKRLSKVQCKRKTYINKRVEQVQANRKDEIPIKDKTIQECDIV